MNLLLLAGNSKRNQEWIHAVDRVIKPLFNTTVVQEYQHWQTGVNFIDLDAELNKAAQNTRSLDPYIIFAKSVGCLLALMGMRNHVLHPHKCIFTGLALKLIMSEKIPLEEWLGNNQIPILILQNEADPAGSYVQVKESMSKVPNCTIAKLPGDTHEYNDLQKLKDIIATYLN